jgi:hypothetical protein
MVGNVVAADEHAGGSQPAWLGHRPLGRWGFTEQPLGDGLAGEHARGQAVAAQPDGDQASAASWGSEIRSTPGVVGVGVAWSAWTPTLPQVPNRVAPPRSTTKDPCPWGRVTNSRDPMTKRSQALGSLNTKRAAWPGRSTTRDPAGPPGTDGAVNGCPWEPSSRTPGMPLTVQLLTEVLRSWTRYQMWPAAPSLSWTVPATAEAVQRPVIGWPPDERVVEGGMSGPGLVVGAGYSGGAAVPAGWGVADGWEVDERAR